MTAVAGRAACPRRAGRSRRSGSPTRAGTRAVRVPDPGLGGRDVVDAGWCRTGRGSPARRRRAATGAAPGRRSTDGGDRGDAEPLVDLGAAGVVDPGDDLLDAERLAGHPRRDDVGVVTAGDGGERVGRRCRPLQHVLVEADAGDLSPVNAGPRRRNASGSGSMMETVWLRSSRLRASVDPTRPQPMITTCTTADAIGHGACPAWASLPLVGVGDVFKRVVLGQASCAAPSRRDAAAQAHGAAGLRQRRAVVGGLRARRDLHHAGAGRRVGLRLVLEDRPRRRRGDG